MRSCFFLSMLSVLLLTLRVGGQGLEADDLAQEDRAVKEVARPTGQEAALTTEKTFASFGQMIPMGTKNRKVRIPSFDKGRATSLITADAMTRVTDKELFAEDMVIESYAVNPKENLRVQLITATYDMEKRTLSSTQRSKVLREDFSIEGDSMIYDTTNASGKMVGRVILVIKDPQSIKTGPSKEPLTNKSDAPSPRGAEAKTKK
jgi:hypothetical protein